jgi:hypothetical protein
MTTKRPDGDDGLAVLGIGGEPGGRWFVLAWADGTARLLAGPYRTEDAASRFVETFTAPPEVDILAVVQSTGSWRDAVARADDALLEWKNMTPAELQARIVHRVEDDGDDDEDDER